MISSVQIDEEISKLNATLSDTAPHKHSQGESLLDRMPDSMVLFAEMAENEDWIHEENSDEDDGVHAGEDVTSPESPPPLEDDPDIMAITEHLNELNKQHDEAQNETVMLRPITRKEQEYVRQRMLTLSKHRQAQRKVKQVRRAAYMPSMHSRIYKEWTETQAAQVIFCNVLNMVLHNNVYTDMLENSLGHLDPQRRQPGEALNSLHHFLFRTAGRSAQTQ